MLQCLHRSSFIILVFFIIVPSMALLVLLIFGMVCDFLFLRVIHILAILFSVKVAFPVLVQVTWWQIESHFRQWFAFLFCDANLFLMFCQKCTASFSLSVLLPPLCLSLICKFRETSEPYIL